MELEKLPMPINPRGAHLRSGRYDRRRRVPAKWETADTSTKRQRTKPVDFRAGSCQNYTDSPGPYQNPCVFFDLYRQF
jgi:hypothetical protein